MTTDQLWAFLVPGYLATVLVECPVLLLGLSRRHSIGRRLFASFWLTACTYPIVVLVLPVLIDPVEARGLYLAVAETFAPVAECLLFWAAFGSGSGGRVPWRDLAAVAGANVVSFLVGLALTGLGVL